MGADHKLSLAAARSLPLPRKLRLRFFEVVRFQGSTSPTRIAASSRREIAERGRRLLPRACGCRFGAVLGQLRSGASRASLSPLFCLFSLTAPIRLVIDNTAHAAESPQLELFNSLPALDRKHDGHQAATAQIGSPSGGPKSPIG